MNFFLIFTIYQNLSILIKYNFSIKIISTLNFKLIDNVLKTKIVSKYSS